MKFLAAVLPLLVLAPSARAAAPLLVPQTPIELTGTHGRFDFIKVDSAGRRLLACHTGNGSLDVIDIDSGKLAKSIPTGNAQGVAIDGKNGRYFVSVSKPPQLVIVDAATLAATGTVALPEAADVCAYSETLNRVAVDDDEKPIQWMIDPNQKAITGTITFSGAGMEDLAFISAGRKLVQNLKDTSQLGRVDPAKGQVTEVFATAPAEKPHGLAVVEGTNRVLIAGGAGKMVLMDAVKGKVLASADIAPRVDEIGYDAGIKRVYCASGTGEISVVAVDGDNLTALGNVPSAPGAHSIAVDLKTHTVWIVFAKGDVPCAQAFTVPKP